MKTNKLINFKQALSFFSLLLLSLSAFSIQHVTMSLKNIRTTSNSIEYDLYIINDGSTTLKLSACSYGVNFNQAILNGGTVSYSYVQNTRGTALNGLTAFSLNTTKNENINQVRMTSTPSKFEIAPELVSNVPFKVGRFKITNSVAWTANSNPALSLQEEMKIGVTTTQVVAYIDGVNKLTALTPNKKTVATYVEASPILNASNATIVNNTDSHQDVSSTTQSNGLLANNQTISIYPNPVEDILNLDIPATFKQNISIRISDMKGSLVKQIQTDIVEGMNKINIDVTPLVNGIYTIKISNNKEVMHSQTFSKQ